MFALKKFFTSFFLLVFLCSIFPFPIQANLAQHIVISEVLFGNLNADDEFIELYNPTNNNINLQELGLKLHIRNSTGSSDTNKTIEWTNTIIPAKGFFLFVAKNSSSYVSMADAVFSAGLVSHGAVYISFSSEKLDQVIDFIAWGEHQMPTGFELQKTEAFSSGQSIERKSNESGIDSEMGNAWDTDGNDFLVQTNSNPQNTSSAQELFLEIPEEPASEESLEENGEAVAESDTFGEAIITQESAESIEVNGIEDNLSETEGQNESENTIPESVTEDGVVPQTEENKEETENSESFEEEAENTSESEVGDENQTTEEILQAKENNLESQASESVDDEETRSHKQEEEIVLEELAEVIQEEAAENNTEIQGNASQSEVLPYISEIYPYPKKDEFEWIELSNPTLTSIAAGTTLCQGNNCMTILKEVPAESFMLLSTQKIGEDTNIWLDIPSSGSLVWKYNEEILDERNYKSITSGKSAIFQESSKEMLLSSHITPGKGNIENIAPSIVFQIQGSGKSVGNAPFSFNVTAESSYDQEKDSLQFLWNFGNGVFSTEANPKGISYENAGDYMVHLTVTDALGLSSSIEQSIQVLPTQHVSRSSSGSSSTPSASSSLATTPVLPPIQKASFSLQIQRVSPNDSGQDFIEILCKDCNGTQDIGGYSLYDDAVFYTFPQNTFIENKVLKIFLSKESPKESKEENIYFVEKKSGLTKTDEQIVLLDSQGSMRDAICWNNFDETFSQKEQEEENWLKQSNAWQGDCIDSQALQKKDILVSRKIESDSNTKEDWEIISPKKKNFLTKEEIPQEAESLEGIRISELMINPKGADKGQEWMEFENISNEFFSFTGWSLIINNKTYSLSGITQNIDAGAFFVLDTSTIPFSLRNSSTDIQLLNPLGEEKDRLQYEQSIEGNSLSRLDHQFFWTLIRSPGKKNIFLDAKDSRQDSDQDELPDDLEKTLGTDPQNRDSDGDGIPDGFELQHQLDPLFFNEDSSIFQEYLRSKSNASIRLPRSEKSQLTLYGKSEAFAEIKLLLPLQQEEVKMQADIDGKWSYAISSLSKGSHAVELQVKDQSGISTQKYQVLEFELEDDYIFKTPAVKKKTTPKQKKAPPANPLLSPKNFISKSTALPKKTESLPKKMDTLGNEKTSKRNIVIITLLLALGALASSLVGYRFFIRKAEKA